MREGGRVVRVEYCDYSDFRNDKPDKLMNRRKIGLLISAIPMSALAGEDEKEEKEEKTEKGDGGKDDAFEKVTDIEVTWWVEGQAIWLKMRNNGENTYLIDSSISISVYISEALGFARMIGRDLWASLSFFVLGGWEKKIYERGPSVKACLPLNDEEYALLKKDGASVTGVNVLIYRLQVSESEYKRWKDEFGGLMSKGVSIDCRPG